MLKIAEFFIRRPRVANLTLFLIVFMGVLTAMTLKRQSEPTIDFDEITITTQYPGASPDDVEINVTDPIEDELASVDDIEQMISYSMENVSLIYMTVNPDAQDHARVKRDIRDAVDRVSNLPAEVTEKPRVVEIRSTNLPVTEIAITGEVDEMTLRGYARDLEDDLSALPGVGTIEKVGYRKREVHVLADAKKLEDRYVSIGEMMQAIASRNVRATGGSLESYVSEKNIVTFSEYADPMEVKDVIIRSTFSGSRVRISDVAVVQEGFEDFEVIPRANGHHAICLVVRAQGAADVIAVSEKIKERLGAFRKDLPEGISADIINDHSDYTRSLLSLVQSNGLIGFALVMVVMLLFLDWRSAFWTAFGIPIAMAGALLFFPLFDLTINQVTLSAMVLVLGMLVDDAIVISENVYRKKEEGIPPLEATLAGVREVFWPVTASVLTTILAFLPMLFMSGVVGKFVASIPIVVLLMLGLSLIESTCFLPCHIAHIPPPKGITIAERGGVLKRVMDLYARLLRFCLSHRKKVLAGYVAVFLAILVASGAWLKLIIFPIHDPDVFYIISELPIGTSLRKTAEKVTELEEVIASTIPENVLRGAVTRVGTNEAHVYWEVSGGHDNQAIVMVYLMPADERDVQSEGLIKQVEEKLKRLQGYTKLHVKLPESGPPVGKPINVIYISDNDALRTQFEQETIDFLEGIDGVYAVESDRKPGKDELRLKLDYTEMARLGITALEVARTVRAAFDGQVVTSVRKEGEEIDFRVRLLEPTSFQEQGVLELMVTNNLGKLVPIGSFASFEEAKSTAAIHHFDGRRSVTVSGEVDTRRVTATEINALIKEKFGPLAKGQAGFKMELKGEQEKTMQSMKSFYLALAIALVAIFFLLVVLFDSFAQPLLIMSAIPFGVMGVFITFLLHGLPIGFIAMIGILGLTGVVINTSIVMISTINEICSAHGEKTFAAIIEAAVIRFRPVMLTTVTTVAGLLPTAYGVGGDLPFIRPMVLAMAWGLVFATMISLFFIPLIYAVSGRVRA